MASSNLPRHGEGIIEEALSSLGGKKFVASRQFQEFLDQLGSLFNQGDIDVSDITQLLASDSGDIERLKAENRELKKIILSVASSFAELDSVVMKNRQEQRTITKRLNDVEQLANVN